MRLAKRTYSLPFDLIQRFEEQLTPGERSRFVAKLIDDWLSARERERLRREVIDGCREMAELYRAIDAEWNDAADEVWRDAK